LEAEMTDRETSLDANRRAQFAFLLELDFKTLKQVVTGVEHLKGMAELYEYPLVGELSDALVHLDQGVRMLRFARYFANDAVEEACKR
jgi:succinyl-CoA synthetase alpha subunit